VAYPTEGVFGLGCDPYNRDAVHRLLRLKNRPVAQGLILIHSTVALRVTAHPLANRVCRLFGQPLVSTSANRRGQPAAVEAEAVSACTWPAIRSGSNPPYKPESP